MGAMMQPLRRSLFRSFFMAGFECSSHRRADGRRLDLLAMTEHDRRAREDYASIAAHGIRTARDGLRWHLIETGPGSYDWSSFLPMLRAAEAQRMQVIWDLCHYGWPDDLDIWSAAFVDRFAAFAGAVARVVRSESGDVPFYCPINEISYWAWAGGEVGLFNPAATGRGVELKRQLVRASIAAIDAIRAVDPRARFVTAEPLIHVEACGGDAGAAREARSYSLSQFEAVDMLAGRTAPELGGREAYIDLVGVNYYPLNQWYLDGRPIPMGHHAYRDLRGLLAAAFVHHNRPLFIAETGAEGSGRAAWLHYVSGEVRAAQADGVPILGICLYPILDYPGWENERICKVGLLSSPSRDGTRLVCPGLGDELHRQQAIFDAAGADRLVETPLGSAV